MNTIRRDAAAVFAAGLSVAAASGQVQLFFEEPGFEWNAQGFNATPYHIWLAGDSWAQTFPPTMPVTGVPRPRSRSRRLAAHSIPLQAPAANRPARDTASFMPGLPLAEHGNSRAETLEHRGGLPP